MRGQPRGVDPRRRVERMRRNSARALLLYAEEQRRGEQEQHRADLAARARAMASVAAAAAADTLTTRLARCGLSPDAAAELIASNPTAAWGLVADQPRPDEETPQP